ncbi:hypothetical protein LbFV_ORF31 [Leptopilina boulardi filamentous virus]|uniref:Uncharacterized protein n=1 Tax=Leptopilina boulardi filamentous virus TaxID=552509 RepID=A0A1S5YCZ8_9VIRU|nr:hypothetical protein LbFV_ORF31 [Leptopilina boulardi filamentous virus]AQQ79951.1 hypothetical protein LbFV_ORF31 [Leptopilina boulardi filamentous virus]
MTTNNVISETLDIWRSYFIRGVSNVSYIDFFKLIHQTHQLINNYEIVNKNKNIFKKNTTLLKEIKNYLIKNLKNNFNNMYLSLLGKIYYILEIEQINNDINNTVENTSKNIIDIEETCENIIVNKEYNSKVFIDPSIAHVLQYLNNSVSDFKNKQTNNIYYSQFKTAILNYKLQTLEKNENTNNSYIYGQKIPAKFIFDPETLKYLRKLSS